MLDFVTQIGKRSDRKAKKHMVLLLFTTFELKKFKAIGTKLSIEISTHNFFFENLCVSTCQKMLILRLANNPDSRKIILPIQLIQSSFQKKFCPNNPTRFVRASSQSRSVYL